MLETDLGTPRGLGLSPCFALFTPPPSPGKHPLPCKVLSCAHFKDAALARETRPASNSPAQGSSGRGPGHPCLTLPGAGKGAGSC